MSDGHDSIVRAGVLLCAYDMFSIKYVLYLTMCHDICINAHRLRVVETNIFSCFCISLVSIYGSGAYLMVARAVASSSLVRHFFKLFRVRV